MPQMSPMSWFMLYMYFFFIFYFLNIILYYFKSYYLIIKSKEFKKVSINFVNKW